MNAGAQSGVSPYVLAAMILQEQGNNGTSPLISGSYSGYEGYYNFFNVEAYQSGSMSAIEMGLRYASQSGSYGRPWNTVEKSIRGGAQNYGDNYVKAGQNTFYLKKFNVQGANLYKHQYMSNIQGAASELQSSPRLTLRILKIRRWNFTFLCIPICLNRLAWLLPETEAPTTSFQAWEWRASALLRPLIRTLRNII